MIWHLLSAHSEDDALQDKHGLVNENFNSQCLAADSVLSDNLENNQACVGSGLQSQGDQIGPMSTDHDFNSHKIAKDQFQHLAQCRPLPQPAPPVAPGGCLDPVFKSQELANTVWALSPAGHAPPALFDVFAEAAKSRWKDFKSQELAKTIGLLTKPVIPHSCFLIPLLRRRTVA